MEALQRVFNVALWKSIRHFIVDLINNVNKLLTGRPCPPEDNYSAKEEEKSFQGSFKRRQSATDVLIFLDYGEHFFTDSDCCINSIWVISQTSKSLVCQMWMCFNLVSVISMICVCHYQVEVFQNDTQKHRTHREMFIQYSFFFFTRFLSEICRYAFCKTCAIEQRRVSWCCTEGSHCPREPATALMDGSPAQDRCLFLDSKECEGCTYGKRVI